MYPIAITFEPELLDPAAVPRATTSEPEFVFPAFEPMKTADEPPLLLNPAAAPIATTFDPVFAIAALSPNATTEDPELFRAADVPRATMLLPHRFWVDTPARMFALVESNVTGIELMDLKFVRAERFAVVP
jgi:hypothetical protein